MKDPDVTRLFFGLELDAEWPPAPDGRVLDAQHRHCTLAFLGNQNLTNLLEVLKEFKLPPQNKFNGSCDRLLFLPHRKPRVVAGHLIWEDDSCLQIYQKLIQFLNTNHYPAPEKEFLPHVTFARAPFSVDKWKNSFIPFAVKATSLNLYQSIGNLTYLPVWKIPFEKNTFH